MRRHAVSKWRASRSMPVNLRPMRTHATPVVPPTTHPAGMQTPFAHDPMFQHQIPVFIPTHTDDIGIRMVLNMFQSMLAAAGYSIFSYARVVDLFAGFFR